LTTASLYLCKYHYITNYDKKPELFTKSCEKSAVDFINPFNEIRPTLCPSRLREGVGWAVSDMQNLVHPNEIESEI
jgi:hypothetical protein